MSQPEEPAPEVRKKDRGDSAAAEAKAEAVVSLDDRDPDVWPCALQRSRRARWATAAILDDDHPLEDIAKWSFGFGALAFVLAAVIWITASPPPRFLATPGFLVPATTFTLASALLGAFLDVYWVHDRLGGRLLRVASLGPLDLHLESHSVQAIRGLRSAAIQGWTCNGRRGRRRDFDLGELWLDLEQGEPVAVIQRRRGSAVVRREGARLAASLLRPHEVTPLEDQGQVPITPVAREDVGAALLAGFLFCCWMLAGLALL